MLTLTTPWLVASMALLAQRSLPLEPAVHRSCIPRLIVEATGTPRAVLTREDGKNGKLAALLGKRGVPCEDLPCIAFERLPGFDELCDVLVAGGHAWVIITSPEAAGVFVDAWRACDAPQPTRIASVGAGTAQVLADAAVTVDFVPSKATGKTLAAELPASDPPATVVYPASALAADTVETGLQGRGFVTRRINTYTTVPATWSKAEWQRAGDAEVVTFASPSAVRVWADRVGTGATAVCIGETSADEARRLGFERVHCPEQPGVATWADAVASLGLWAREKDS